MENKQTTPLSYTSVIVTDTLLSLPLFSQSVLCSVRPGHAVPFVVAPVCSISAEIVLDFCNLKFLKCLTHTLL